MQSHMNAVDVYRPFPPHSLVPWHANSQPSAVWDDGDASDVVGIQQAHGSLRIMIVNDDMKCAARLKQTLLTLGFSETLVAYSGKRALAAISVYRPAVAIVDLCLNDMTGYGLARSLRAHALTQVRETPLIAVAERSALSAGALARAAGFIGLLSKPVPSWLLNTLLVRSLT